jgi:sugar phosphate isomerase/epimerase
MGITAIYLDTGTVSQASIADIPTIAASAGYAGLELWHHDVDPTTLSMSARTILRERYGVHHLRDVPTDLRRLRAECERLGLLIDGVVPPLDFAFRWHDDLGPETRALIGRELPKYQALGLRYVVLPVLGENGDLASTGHILRELGEMLRPFALMAALEPIGHIRKASRVADALSVLEHAGPDANAGLIVDCFHFFQAGNALSTLLDVPPQRIVTVHLNDAMDLPVHELSGARNRVHPGEGVFDVVTFCGTLAANGYGGPCAVEVLNEGYRQLDPQIVANQSLRASRSVIDAAPSDIARSGRI